MPIWSNSPTSKQALSTQDYCKESTKPPRNSAEENVHFILRDKSAENSSDSQMERKKKTGRHKDKHKERRSEYVCDTATSVPAHVLYRILKLSRCQSLRLWEQEQGYPHHLLYSRECIPVKWTKHSLKQRLREDTHTRTHTDNRGVVIMREA